MLKKNFFFFISRTKIAVPSLSFSELSSFSDTGNKPIAHSKAMSVCACRCINRYDRIFSWVPNFVQHILTLIDPGLFFHLNTDSYVVVCP